MSSRASLPAPARCAAGLLVLGVVGVASAAAQGSVAALRFHGTGAGERDRAWIPLDDDAPGPDASAPLDVGAGSFTLQFWVRGLLADNPAPSSGAQGSYGDERWLLGHALLDRSAPQSGRSFGVSLAGGRVRFGTGPGDGPAPDLPNTLEGDAFVLDGLWHHVSVTRDALTGHKTIFVDGQLDIASPANTSRADLSYPDAGLPGSGLPCAPCLVVGAAQGDGGRPAFRGRVDELHVWSRTRRGAEVAADMLRPVPAGTAALVGAYRFEEGAGTALHDTSGAGSPTGTLVAGVPGDGEWSLLAQGADAVAPITSPSLPAGFSRQVVATGLAEPTGMAIAPDGRILVAQRLGHVRVVRDGALLPTPALAVPIGDASGERGLLGLVCDPEFGANGWFYVYGSSPSGRNRVVRYTLLGDVADPASAFVVWEDAQAAGLTHMGGGLAITAGGLIILATGEHGSGASSRDVGSERGKVLRFGRDGSIPPDNPFLGVPGARPSIFATGLRNPYRLALDPLDGSIWIGDVGGNSATAWEELNRLAAGADFGWPVQEGLACHQPSCAGITFPAWTYRHDDPAFSALTGGGCITAGAFYRGTQFPPEYRGNLFVGDYAHRWVRRLVFDAAGAVLEAPVFDPQPAAGPIVDLDVGPDGALYTLTYGFGGADNPDGARLVRIAWTGANQPPVAVAEATGATGPAPLAVQFRGSASSDPDQGPAPLTFLWDFGDGTGSAQPDPQHVYAVQGAYEARLSVSDGALTTTSTPLLVRAGTPPELELVVSSPAPRYRAGDTIRFDAWALDAEDGPLPASALTTQVVLVHLAHTHPFLGPLPGAAHGAFTIPVTGHEPADTHYLVRAVARDSSGLESERTVPLLPAIARVVIGTKPAGIPLSVDGVPVATPHAFDGLSGFRHELAAPGIQALNGTSFEFLRWIDAGGSVLGVTPALTWTTPPAGGAPTAEYRALQRTTVAVGAAERNARHESAAGVAFATPGAPDRIDFGRGPAGAIGAGFQFRLPVPRGARVVAARLVARAAEADAAPASVGIRAYDVGSVPAFVAGSPTPLVAHAPLGLASVSWSPPPCLPGAALESPDLAALVQAVVARPDWAPGQTLGMVLEPSGREAGRRSVHNFASGDPPRLVVEWSPPTGPLGGH
ncbi:MAG: PQQ-dependent sugar dehydrogenase [Planctomycetes bacterium]|nr:PQQ-dependent sugar dehydrogenase [Planctomycetota bacterium]